MQTAQNKGDIERAMHKRDELKMKSMVRFFWMSGWMIGRIHWPRDKLTERLTRTGLMYKHKIM